MITSRLLSIGLLGPRYLVANKHTLLMTNIRTLVLRQYILDNSVRMETTKPTR